MIRKFIYVYYESIKREPGSGILFITADCKKRVTPEFSPFDFFPFLPEVFVLGTSRAVQTHFVPSWYKEKWKKWKGENSGVTRFQKPAVPALEFFMFIIMNQ